MSAGSVSKLTLDASGRRRRKLALTGGALAVVAGAVVICWVGLGRIAGWAERNAESYPYNAGEDPIRFLLPDLFATPGRDRILLLGPSAAHEGVLYEDLARAFDRDVFSAGISSGTMDDALVALDLIAQLHGADAVPRTLILGVTIRTVANIPRRFGVRRDVNAYAPTFEAINRYSAFEVVPGEYRSRLVRKGLRRRLSARLAFLLKKQQPRFRAGLAAAAGRGVGEHPLWRLHDRPWPRMDDHRQPLTGDNITVTFGLFRELGVVEALRYWLPFYRSPYYTAFIERPSTAALRARLENGWRPKLDVSEDTSFVQRQFGDLLDTCRSLGIELYVVNLPENPIAYDLYPEGVYDKYYALLEESLKGVPLLDLRRYLSGDDFVDEVHPRHRVARRVTERIIRFIRAERAATSGGGATSG